MKDKNDLILPEDLLYSGEHIWIKPDKESWKIGITDYAQDQLGGIVFIDLPEPGKKFKSGEEFGSVESVKSVNGLFMPVDAEILEVNEKLEDDPAEINRNCYETGWIARIKPAKPETATALANAKEYRATLK